MPAYWIWLSQRTGMGNKAKLELKGMVTTLPGRRITLA